MRKCGLRLAKVGDSLGVGRRIDARLCGQVVEELFGIGGKGVAIDVAVERKRLKDVEPVAQKKVSLALALTSAEAVKGMRVV